MREAFEDNSIDAVSIATPNHWHALAAIWACQAGKDVYVEKPLAHSFWEGQQLVKAAEKYQRIVQHGTQQRSDPACRRDMKLLHEGTLIGPVVHARGYAAHGFFETYESLAAYTRADLFQRAGEKTPAFVRFSTVAGILAGARRGDRRSTWTTPCGSDLPGSARGWIGWAATRT